MSTESSAAHRRVRLAGLAILAAGWIAAACVYVAAGPDGEGADDLARQREMQAVERLGGTATVRTVEFDAWLSSLWHGRRLAGTLALLSLVVAGGCLYIGGLMAEEADE